MLINTMKFRWINNLILLLIATLIGLGFCEVVARLITKTNEDGQAYYGKRPLLPYHFPAEMVRKKMDHYFSRQSEAYVIDDPLLGWTIGPNRTNVEGMYRSNSAGIRSRPNEYPLSPPNGVLRIELFGDSFTHGDEEPFHETWGKFLEDNLIEAGISAEVLNFGVPGYGIGQAYLRWKYVGQKYSPRFVVFGFQPENIKRTVNIFRSLYSRNTWLVFSKPRFFVNDEAELELVNSPVIPPKEVGDVLEYLSQSSLAEHEYWFVPANYRQSFWLKSRFLALLYTFFNEYKPKPGGRYDHRPGRHYWDPEGEPMQTSLLILKKFAREARNAGEIPIILHIPKKNDIKYLERGTRPAHYKVLDELEESGIMVVDPAPEMKGESRLYKHSHYSSRGGRIVARVLSDAIVGLLSENNLNDAFQGKIPSRKVPDPSEILLDRYNEINDLLIDVGTADDELFIKNGFYHREKHLHRTPVRWTGQTAVLRIPLSPGEKTQPVISFHIIDTGTPRDKIGSATVAFNSEEIGNLILRPGDNIYQLQLSSPIINQGIAIMTFSSSTWQPRRDLGVKDSRELGVMLDWVKVEYVQKNVIGNR